MRSKATLDSTAVAAIPRARSHRMDATQEELLAASGRSFVAPMAIVVLVTLAYVNSFSGPFIFDDPDAILDNPTIRHLSDFRQVLSPPRGMTVSGRPLLNVSLAVNHALSGSAVWSYHALNLAIHLAASLTLFGLVRRTLQLPALRERFGSRSRAIAFAVSALWALHPLQTEAVTYVVQRAESLMGLWYLLTLYCFVRATEADAARARGEAASPMTWRVSCVLGCACGMATKEVMVSAPLLVLLYDRTCVSGGFRAALRRWRTYVGLFATYIVLIYLVLSTGGNRGGSAGFDVGVSPTTYWMTQFEAVAHYLRLAGWPHPLVFEYGFFPPGTFAHRLPYVVGVVGLIGGTVVALWRAPLLGLAGAWFFAILAPTSIVPGTTQMIVEHRMYLALVPVLAVAIAVAFRACGPRAMIGCVLAAAGCGLLTAARNRDYRAEISIWDDTASKRPNNPLAHYALGNALLSAGRLADAVPRFEAALQLKPDYAEAHYNLGNALLRLDQVEAAIEHYRAAIRINASLAAAHSNLGNVLVRTGKAEAGILELQAALRIDPGVAETHYALANAFKTVNRESEAMTEYEATLRLAPDHFRARNNLGNALTRLGRGDEAIAHFQAALRVEPNNAMLHVNLGNAYFALHRWDDARTQYARALQLEPANAAANEALARLPPR